VLIGLASGLTAPALAECGHEPAYRRDEAAALKKAQGRAVRDGSVLRIKTAVGPVVFKDTDCEKGPAAKCVNYALAEFLPEQGLWVVHVGYFEGEDYKLIDLKTGKVTDINGFPWFSPDGNRFAAVTNDSHSGVYVLLIWKRTHKKFRKEWDYNFSQELPGTEWSYCVEGWQGSEQVNLEGLGNGGELTGKAQLTFDHKTWRYERLKP
jgi:hypothetical protein